MHELYNEKKIKKFCKLSDDLIAKFNNELVISLTELHFLNAHPEYIKKIKNFFYMNQNNKEKKKINILLYIKKLFNFLNYESNFYFNKKHYFEADYILVSHITNLNSLNEKNDFYYDQLPIKLNKENKILLVYINHANLSISQIKLIVDKFSIPTLVLPRRNFLLEEMKNFLKIFFFTSKIKKNNKKFSNLFSVNSYPSYLFNLRILQNFNKVLNIFTPKIVICTFEGHAFERLVFFLCNTFHNKIKSVGYQFSILRPIQHALFRPLAEIYNPKYIYCSGNISFEKFTRESRYKKTIFDICGSPKFHKVKKKKINKKLNTVLVTPEGFISECKILFNFSLDCAYKYPFIKFIWRLHPETNIKTIIQELGLSTFPKNIFFSKDTLNDDITKSDFILYRGSSVCIHALNNGLVPIYLNYNKQLSINPIYFSRSFYINNSDELCDLINKFNKKDSKVLNKLKIIKKICNNYYTIFKINKFQELIKKF
jgi:hypothetical protein